MIDFIIMLISGICEAALRRELHVVRTIIFYEDRAGGECLFWCDLGQDVVLGPGERFDFDFNTDNLRIEMI